MNVYTFSSPGQHSLFIILERGGGEEGGRGGGGRGRDRERRERVEEGVRETTPSRPFPTGVHLSHGGSF